jgi:hypothetical protein
MKQRINNCPVNLHTLGDDQLSRLIDTNRREARRINDEREVLVAEWSLRNIGGTAPPRQSALDPERRRGIHPGSATPAGRARPIGKLPTGHYENV